MAVSIALGALFLLFLLGTPVAFSLFSSTSSPLLHRRC